MGRFEKQFAHLKAPRKLVWKPTLGSVTLDVKVGDVTVSDVACTPLQATILFRFGGDRYNEYDMYVYRDAPLR